MTDVQQAGGRDLRAPARTNKSNKKGPDEAPAFPDEIAHLDDIKGKLNGAIKQANDSVEQIDQEYMDFKRYMVQNRGEIDPHEMFQNELVLKRIDHRGACAVEMRDKLAKLLDSPYFARMDFREASQETPAAFYIGRFAFSHKGELLISDWRSPVASMFYDCEVGSAGYDAPAGRIGGELTRKRQFKIKNGEMEYALESSVNIQDDIRHLVIDEMQDYTPVQYAVMNILFKGQKTILGDFGQFINPNHSHTLEDLRKLYESAELVELNKSYRSTYEIITFAKRIQNVASLEAAPRHGDAPDLIYCRGEQEELAQIKEKIDAFQDSGNTALGIILKTNGAAKALYDVLSRNCKVHLIAPESAAFVDGISITSIQMSKGLEFDEVIIPAANHATYSSEYDRRLLYIACTRALHRLSLTYTGELTGLIGA